LTATPLPCYPAFMQFGAIIVVVVALTQGVAA
jgi:hypothetical protein